MEYIDNILFALILVLAIGLFARNLGRIRRNIGLGRHIDRSDRNKERWINVLKVAFGQSRMGRKPVAALLHLVVYVGFLIVNIELLEIVIDGIFGSHRAFSGIGPLYGLLIGSFEILAVLVLVSVIVFWIRRMILRIPRFWNAEMKGFPKNDALYILYFEMVLMSLFLIMNGSDVAFQMENSGNLVSGYLFNFLEGFGEGNLYLIERSAWWLHIIGILIFLNYLYYSKHLHIILAFPNTYYANLDMKGRMENVASVTKEVKLMMDPDADPYAVQEDDSNVETFGASDVFDLNRIQLLNAYTCTECGRCTASCPANITGKELSPRAVMMATRDRLEEVGKHIDKNGKFESDGKQLIDDYIAREAIWACTSCNACTEECPVLIDPLSIIMEMRRYLVMEQSAAPQELNIMMTNIENNGAPWPYNQMDRLNWKDE